MREGVTQMDARMGYIAHPTPPISKRGVFTMGAPSTARSFEMSPALRGFVDGWWGSRVL